jgi:hypothetical protein
VNGQAIKNLDQISKRFKKRNCIIMASKSIVNLVKWILFAKYCKIWKI